MKFGEAVSLDERDLAQSAEPKVLVSCRLQIKDPGILLRINLGIFELFMNIVHTAGCKTKRLPPLNQWISGYRKQTCRILKGMCE